MSPAAAADSRDPRSKASLTFAARQTFVRPHQRVITALINEFHQAVSDRDLEAQQRLRLMIEQELDTFDASDGDGHAYPNWIRPTMRANASAAFGELEQAIDFEQQAAQSAELDMHKAISANNLSDHYRRLGRYRESVDFARRAYELWPENDGIIVNLALALYKADLREEAGRIIEELARVASLDDPRNILTAHLRFEEEMREMADLPQVRALLERAAD